MSNVTNEANAELIASINAQIQDNPIMLYMKGTPDFPQCGFSMQAVQALKACGAKFAFLNILEHPDVRATLPTIANWPTYPQLYVNGELIGGCDIIVDLQSKGELQAIIDSAKA